MVLKTMSARAGALLAALVGAALLPPQGEPESEGGVPRRPFWPVHPLLATAGARAEPAFTWRGRAPWTVGDFLSWLLSREGAGRLADFAFEAVVARAAEEEGLEGGLRDRAGKLLEEELARRRILPDDPLRTDLEIALAARIRHGLRVEALVARRRKPSEEDLHRLFDELYGVDGIKVEVAHALFSFIVTEKELAARGLPPAQRTPERIDRATRRRLERLLADGADFDRILAACDLPAVQTAKDARARLEAARIPGYNYQRYGSAFAAAVRALQPGQISKPVRSSHGWHVVKLLARKVTRFADVRPELERRFRAAPVAPDEERALKRELLARYGVRLAR